MLLAVAATAALSACAGTAVTTPTPAAQGPFLAALHASSQLASTVPANGDINPYGLAVVPSTAGKLVAGSALVSNFNAASNVQGTGSTIVQVSSTGAMSLFAQVGTLPGADPCPGGVGLTTALAILPGGWVVVGSLPTAAGALPTPNPAGCLIVLDDNGNVAETWTNADINGPWDLTVSSTATTAQLYVSNVLSRGAGDSAAPPASVACTVVRIDVALGSGPPTMTGSTVIGSGFPWQANATALVQGPTGVALGGDGTLYVVETMDSSITSIADAATRTTPVAYGSATLIKGGALNGPLGLVAAPNGDLVAANGNDGNIVEVSPQGRQVTVVTLIPSGAGDLFGLAIAPQGGLLYTNDGVNALDLFHPGVFVSPTAIPTSTPTG